MAGIYIHYPYCRKACHYCDFHFSTNLNTQLGLVQALLKEIKFRADYLKGEKVETIYFGGGTPSIMDLKDLESIINSIYTCFEIDNKPEITFEINPEDWDRNKFEQIKNLGINRLSIGVQSFDEGFLKFMNRNHSSTTAINAVENAHRAGFDNISIDLIYGIPFENHIKWECDLKIAKKLPITHISSYCLTIEEQTVFGMWAKKKKLKFSDDEFEAIQFEILVGSLSEFGFEQYEISNFCKTGFESKHNSNYWRGKNYIGFGPGAHSYDGVSRQWNVSNNNIYITALENNISYFEREILDNVAKGNEYLLVSLRTKTGTDIEKLIGLNPNHKSFYEKEINKLISMRMIEERNGSIYLSSAGKLMADSISEQLFI